MSDVVLLVPNDWVSEKVLIAVTGLKPGTILRARKECWLVGREYVHVSPDGNPKPSSECMYNRKAVDAWVADSSSEQIAMLNQRLADFAPQMPQSIHSSARALLKSVS